MNESKTKLGIATECGHCLKRDIPKKYLKVLAALRIGRNCVSQPGLRRPSFGFPREIVDYVNKRF